MHRDRSRGGRSRSAEPLLYAIFAGALVLWVGCHFYASVRLQTAFTASPPISEPGEWSAPLDDVFIHFDFARAIARGHPFEWSEGNGYSSGGTSLLYPFVLAPGWWLGFRGPTLVLWAAIVAAVCTFGLLLACRRLFRELPRPTSYLAPVAVLGVGALAWSLWSGMEVALFLGLWGGALVAWDDLLWGVPGSPPRRSLGGALLLGLWCAALVATRPESATTVAVLAGWAALALGRAKGVRNGIAVLALGAGPAVLVLVSHAIANRLLTGDSTAAGALAKLEIHHPHLSAADVWNAWKFHLEYQVLRVTHHHFTDSPVFGWIPWALAASALVFRSTRRYALMLWASAIGWVLLISLNGQVRWQNERYTMPAVTWLLLAAALGAGAIATSVRGSGGRAAAIRALSFATVLGAIGLFAEHQLPRYRDQVWFFGRAARNIRDQHTVAGRLIRHGLDPTPRRVLVGDAGAIQYASDLPGLDIIGLGGYRRLPFARATRLGVGASIELIERMPESDRPELLAIYPSWWGVFPLWFGQRIAEVPVRGNVICGGHSKVLYRPDWRALSASARPLSLEPGERVVDAVDVADLVDEKQHEYSVSDGGVFIDMKLLAHPTRSKEDVWDAGRIAPAGAVERFRVSGLGTGSSTRIVLRVAPVRPTTIDVRVDGELVGSTSFTAHDGWLEPSVLLPPRHVKPTIEVSLSSLSERVVHHVFVVERD